MLYGVREEISKHREDIGQINRELTINRPLGKIEGKTNSEKDLDSAVLSAISKIVDVNKQLEDRLSRAETQMKEQADQLSHQLNEARTDPLTGLANRRAFDTELRERLTQWKEQQIQFSLVLIDVDFFKMVNDKYGHPAGDAVLCDLAILLQRTFEGRGFPARIGGEEFAVILPRVAPPKLFKVIELLYNRVNESATTVEGETIRTTISMGLVTVDKKDSIDSLFKRADLALYDAKHGGRNVGYFSDGRKSYRAVPACADDHEPPATQSLELNNPIQADQIYAAKEMISLSDSHYNEPIIKIDVDDADFGNETICDAIGCDEMESAEDAFETAEKELSPVVNELCGDVRQRLMQIVYEESKI